MKTIGVLGGMGPKATLDFLNKVIELQVVKKDQDYVPMIVYCNPQIPDRTDAICDAQESPAQALVDSAQVLEKSGAHVIVIPCVTAHYWLDLIQRSVSIAVLDSIKLCLTEIRKAKKPPTNIGILGTTGTLRARLFERVFEPEGCTVIVPDDEIQNRLVMKAVYDIKRGVSPMKVRSLLVDASNHLITKSAQAIIAACTEIPLSLQQTDVAVPLYDVNDLLAAAALHAVCNTL